MCICVCVAPQCLYSILSCIGPRRQTVASTAVQCYVDVLGAGGRCPAEEASLNDGSRLDHFNKNSIRAIECCLAHGFDTAEATSDTWPALVAGPTIATAITGPTPFQCARSAFDALFFF